MACPASYSIQFGKVGLGFPRPNSKMVLTLAPSNLPSAQAPIMELAIAYGWALELFSWR